MHFSSTSLVHSICQNPEKKLFSKLNYQAIIVIYSLLFLFIVILIIHDCYILPLSIVPRRFFILPGNQSLILTSKVSNKCYSSKEN